MSFGEAASGSRLNSARNWILAIAAAGMTRKAAHDRIPTRQYARRPRPRGAELTAKSWLTEAPMRMLMNNLDPDVAERPGELVVYGGIGRAARDWQAFDRIVASLRRLEGDRRCSCNPASRSACSAPTPTRRAC